MQFTALQCVVWPPTMRASVIQQLEGGDSLDILNSMKAKIAFVFPGQGSQYVGMGKQLYHSSPAARRIFEQADAILGFPLSTLCFEGPQEELDDTINAQPAILTVSIACLEAMKERFGPLGYAGAPSLVAGHSMGEFTALVAAGVVTLANANSPGQTVLSGEVVALQRAMDLAKARGARLVQRLAISIASHSPLMQQASQHFNEMVSRINLRPPEVPL